MVDSTSPRAWTSVRVNWQTVVGLRLRTFASRRPRSRPYVQPVWTLPASLRACAICWVPDRSRTPQGCALRVVLATQDITATWNQSS